MVAKTRKQNRVRDGIKRLRKKDTSMIRHSGLLAILIALFSILLALPYINAYRSGLQITPELQETKQRLAKRNVQTRVCLNMIAKDEANDRLIPSLQAAALHITGYIFCDTGSTDGTPKLAKSIFNYLNLKGKIAHHPWKDFAHNRNLCLEDGQRLLGNVCDYWLLLDADQIMVSEDGVSLSEVDMKGVAACFLREVARESEFSNRRVISTKFPWKYFGKVHEVILPANDSYAGKDTTGTLPRSIYSIHESDMGRGFERDAALLESSVQENPTDTRSTFYLANSYNMLNRKEDAIIWWAKRITMGGWEEERYMSALWIASVFDVYLRGKPIAPATWDAMISANLVQEKIREPEAQVNVSIADLISILKAAHTIVPARQEALYFLAKLSRGDLLDYESCVNFAELAQAAGGFNETTLFANIHIYKYGVLDELCVCSFYVPAKRTIGQQACRDLIQSLENEGITETDGAEDLKQMLKLTRQNLKAHLIQSASHIANSS